MRGVARHQPKQEIAAAADHVALTHLGPFGAHGFEGGQHHLFLTFQPDDGEEGDLPAQLLRLGIGVVAADDAGLLQPADAAQARRRGDARPAGQLDIGHTAIGLQFGQDAAVDRVQYGCLGRRFHRWTDLPQGQVVAEFG